MPPFAPKLTSDIGYTQPLAAPKEAPSVFEGIGDVLSGALKTADKAFDSFKPKAPTYQQLKDEDELNSLNAFQTGTEKAAQLRAQGFGGRATSMENQIALDYVRAGGDPTSPEAEYMVERVSGRSHEKFGLSEETHARMKLQETKEYEAAFLATWNTHPKDTPSEDRVQAASVTAMQIFSARSVVAVATSKSDAQAAINSNLWTVPGGGLESFNILIDAHVGPTIGAAMVAQEAGQIIEAKSIVNSSIQFELFKSNILSKRPRGIDDTQWSNVTKRLSGISDVYSALINKGESLKGAHAGAFFQALLQKPNISAVLAHVILNTKDFTTFGLTGKDYASVFTALQTVDTPLYVLGNGNPRDPVSGAPGPNSGNEGPPTNTIPQTVLDAYNGDPKKLLRDMNGISKYFRALDPEAAGKVTQTVANISQKMAASVYKSTVPFAAADINDAYNTGLIDTIREVGKTDPRTAWAMARQHSEALNQMSIKSYQNANKKFGDVAKLGVDGMVQLNWANAFDNLPVSGGTRAFIEGQMKTALGPYNGDLYAFTKAYQLSQQRGSYAPEFTRGVKEFMNSRDMRAFMEDGGELKEQMDSLVAINAARGRMQAEADLIENAYNTAVDVGDEFTQEVAPDAAPVPRERPVEPVVVQEPERLGGILGMGGLPRTAGPSGAESAVSKVGEALGDAARYVGDALISPAGAGTLPPPRNPAIEHTLKNEGGYQDDKNDPGNFDEPENKGRNLGTNRGVTSREWAKYKGVAVSTLTVQNMKDITEEQAYAFYKDRFEKFGVDKYPQELQLQIFDMTTQHRKWKTVIENAKKNGELTNNTLVDARVEYIKDVVAKDKKKGGGLYLLEAGMINRAESYRSAPVPRPRPDGADEVTRGSIMDTVTQTVPDATPEEVKEATDSLQGAITLDDIRALGARQRAIMASILYAYSEEEQGGSTVGFGPYSQPTPRPLGE